MRYDVDVRWSAGVMGWFAVWRIMAWYVYGMACTVWYGIVSYDSEWYGMVWCGRTLQNMLNKKNRNNLDKFPPPRSPERSEPSAVSQGMSTVEKSNEQKRTLFLFVANAFFRMSAVPRKKKWKAISEASLCGARGRRLSSKAYSPRGLDLTGDRHEPLFSFL